MEPAYTKYSDAVHAALQHWPELAWLNRFLQTPQPSGGEATSAIILDLVGDTLQPSRTAEDADAFHELLKTIEPGIKYRVVALLHGLTFDVDRSMVNVLCDRYQLDPRFVSKHFAYDDVHDERNCPQDMLSNFCDEHALRGEIMCPLSVSDGSCFTFTFGEDCLSLALHQEEDSITGRCPHQDPFCFARY